MKNLKGTKSFFNQVSQKFYSKLQTFNRDQQGEGGPVGWVIGVFVALVLFIGVYALFKTQIDTFVTTQIFGRMNQLN